MSRPSTGKTVYILDEPTTGLHFDDLRKLLDVLHRFSDMGNTVILVEHNLDVIKTADWVIDLGPEAGDEGGRIVAEGTPEDVAKVAASHTGRLIKKVLDEGPHRERPIFDPKKAAAKELEVEKAARPDRGSAKMPWQRDGVKWHTSQRMSREGKTVEWEGAALLFVVKEIERLGKGKLQPTDWSDRSRVEIVGKAPEGLAQSAVPWLFHALTGGRWLLDLNFRVPHGVFQEAALDRNLGLKALDDRDDIHAYGQASRVQFRPAREGFDPVRITVHDKKEIDTPKFRAFLRKAVESYLKQIAGMVANKSKAAPWKADGKAWHLSQKSIPLTQNKLWKPVELMTFIGRASKAVPQMKVDWNGKVFVELLTESGQRIGKIITHQGEAIRVDVHVPRGRFTPTQVEHLGLEQQFARPGSSGAELTFWFQSNEQVHGDQLANVLRSAARDNGE